MKLLLKIIALPFIITLSVLVAFMTFLFSLSNWLFIFASTILGIMGAVLLISGNGLFNSFVILFLAFLVSPFGLPALAEFIIDLFDSLNCSLKSFLTS